MPGHGSIDAKIAFVAESPGREEDVKGEPLIGPAGQRFDRQIIRVGLCRAVSSVGGDACITHAAQAPSLSAGDAYDPQVDSPCSTHVGSAGQPVPDLALRQGMAAYHKESEDWRLAQGYTSDNRIVACVCSSNPFLQHRFDRPTFPEIAEGVEDRSHQSIYASGEQGHSVVPVAPIQYLYSHRHQKILLGTQFALSCPYCTTLHESCQPVFLENTVHCRPPGNRLTDYPDALARCPDLWLHPTLAALKSLRVVVALGATAGSIWFPGMKATDIASLARVYRRTQQYCVVGSFHPSYALRSGGEWNEIDASIVRSLQRALVYSSLMEVSR